MDGGPKLWRGEQVAMPPRFWVQYVARGAKLCENVTEASKKHSLHFGNMLCVDGPIMAIWNGYGLREWRF